MKNRNNIYEFRINGEKDWVSASTMIEAIYHYIEVKCMNFEEFTVNDDVVLIPTEKWVDYKAFDEEFSGKEITFQEWMDENPEDVGFIATTEI